MNFARIFRVCSAVLAVTPFVSHPAAADFIKTNLVSDGFVPAVTEDQTFVNPWGVSYAPGGPFWISVNGSGTAVLFDGAGKPFPAAMPLTVTLPTPAGDPNPATPTGQVFNGSSDFVVSQGGKSAPATFLFATEDGTISGWNRTVNPDHAILAVPPPGPAPNPTPVYKGLAIASNGGANFLYAANFRDGTVDVFDSSFAKVGSFTDPTVPAGFAPFNVQRLGNKLYVTYAMQNADRHDDVAGAGNGFVRVFRPDGTLLQRLVSQGPLDSPWGLALAPADFGQFAGDLLVGNFGDGAINVFDLDTGAFLGALTDANGQPLSIDGLWALIPGNGGVGNDPNLIYFTAGPNHEMDGLFGSLSPIPEPAPLALLAAGVIGLSLVRRPR